MTIREFAAAQEGPHSLCYTAVVDEAERQIAEVNEALRLANAKHDRIGDLLDKLSPDWEGEYVDVIREFHRQLVASVLSAEAMRRALEAIRNEVETIADGKQEDTRNAYSAGVSHGWTDAQVHIETIIAPAVATPPSAHLDRIRREAAAEENDYWVEEHDGLLGGHVSAQHVVRAAELRGGKGYGDGY